jgi:hypothetical protein
VAEFGRRGGLKIRWPFGLVGSSPTPGTKESQKYHLDHSLSTKFLRCKFSREKSVNLKNILSEIAVIKLLKQSLSSRNLSFIE